jgi:microfibrillar-associated protein 1
MEKERGALHQKQVEIEAEKMAEERRKYTLKMVEDDIRKETSVKDDNEPSLHYVNTDDENDEVEYEAWKLRELKRLGIVKRENRLNGNDWKLKGCAT